MLSKILTPFLEIFPPKVVIPKVVGENTKIDYNYKFLYYNGSAITNKRSKETFKEVYLL